MKLSFVAYRSDSIAVRALESLTSYSTRIIECGVEPPEHSIGLFSVPKIRRDRFLRLATYRMEQEGITVPAWASELPFLVAINAELAQARRHDLAHALHTMAKEYQKWESWMMKPEAPWNPGWQHGGPHLLFEPWRQRVADMFGNPQPIAKLACRLRPVFPINTGTEVERLVITGCALFNQPHTDVTDTIPEVKRRDIVRMLGDFVLESGIRDVSFIVPGSDLLVGELRDHFHPFIFSSLEDVARHTPHGGHASARLFGAAHAHARSDAEIARALERSGDALVKAIAEPIGAITGVPIRCISWTQYIGEHITKASDIAHRHRSVAESVYLERVRTRTSYQSLHKLDPERGLKRTVANNIFYLAEAMYLKANPETAVMNCEFADTFWTGLEQILEQEVWGAFRPFIGMVPEEVRQPWGY